MGADVVGWRNCALQAALTPTGFLRKQKLRSYKAAVEAMVSPEQRSKSLVNPVSNPAKKGEPAGQMTYSQIVAELQEFEAGILDCATCPLGRQKPVGCYGFVNYPIDAFFEQALFDFFVEQLADPRSPAAALAEQVLPRIAASSTDWHDRRGRAEGGALAALPKPLVHSSGGLFSKRRFDSAQMLAALFQTLEDPGWIMGMTLFLLRLVEFAVRRAGAEQSQTLQQVKSILPIYAGAAGMAQTGGAKILIDG